MESSSTLGSEAPNAAASPRALWVPNVDGIPVDAATLGQALLASVPMVVVIEDERGTVLWANEVFAEVMGLPLQRAAGRNVEAFVHGSDREAFRNFRRNMHAGTKAHVIVRAIRPDGEEVCLRLAGKEIGGEGDLNFVLTGEDITAVRTAVEAQERAEARYRAMVESSSDLVWEVDGAGNWTFLNAAAWDIYGLTPPQLRGTSVTARRAASEESCPIEIVLGGRALADFETRHVDAGGREKYLSFSGSPVRGARGQVIGARGTARDVTPRVHARQADSDLGRQLSLLRSLINNTPDPIYYKDTEGLYVGCNLAFEKLAGITEIELVGKDDKYVFGGDTGAERDRTDRQLIARGETARSEEWITYSDGRRVLLDTLRTPFRSETGEALGLIGIGRDLTHHKLAEEQLQDMAEQARRATQMKSAFLANMSHEIRTPMNGVLGMTELLLGTDLDPQQRQSAQLIQTSGVSLLRILDDILDFSKIEAGQLLLEETPFDLWRTVDAASRVLAVKAASRGTELIIDIRPDVPRWVVGDSVRLRQVITNLTSNAVKFTEGGEVVVTAEVVDSDGVSSVRLSVRDSGIGIPSAKLETIFEEFQQADTSTTRHYGGTGLGLAISRRIVELMDGQMVVESEEGVGSEFHFTVPFETAEAAEEQTLRVDPALLEGKCLLIVDDHPLNRRIARSFFETVGARTIEAESGEDALARIHAATEAGERIDAAVVDFLMPGMDGFGLTERLREIPVSASIPIIMLTSADRPEDVATAAKMGIEYLTKPIARAELLESVAATFLDRSAPSADAGASEDSSPVAAPVGAKLLLAEDNRVNQMVARSLLEKRGYAVTVVNNGLEAVEAALSGDFDLVLMDVQMPELDGLGAAERIRETLDSEALPIVALTAHALEAERRRCVAVGMDGFVSKPFRPEELFGVIDGLTGVGGSVHAGGTGPSSAERSEKAPQKRGPAVRIDKFRELMREAGVESIVEDTLKVYIEESPQRLKKLSAGVAAGDGRTIEQVAHAMKSASRNIWAVDLADLLEKLETAAVDGDLASAGELAPGVEAEFTRVIDYLSGVLREAG